LKQEYLTVLRDGEVEMEIKKSRFLTHIKRVKSEDEAKAFIQAIKKEHWRANHNCSAYILGQNMEIQRSSDDGEPSGTAGVPMLEVLKRNELIDLVVVVTRYFGGIKLGAGGLIRAYAGSVSNALDEIGLAKGVLQQELEVVVDYTNVGKLQKFMEENPQYMLGNTIYEDSVKFFLFSEEKDSQNLQNTLIDLLNGKIKITEKHLLWTEIPYQKPL
jgi:uncharacterized YigZ family protein